MGMIAMDMNRNRYFMIGVLLILLGVQFRMVDSFVLNEPTTRAMAKMSKKSNVVAQDSFSNFLMQVHPKPTKRVHPPRWLGLAMIAVGTVVSLHAIAMPRE
ncbi:conserved hypothetical protein, membrane [Rhodopirellula baltica WH47]|jgi:uncharacterized membrane protein|nr:conserved hypothetical protein, membrane [Rhodopirellula baltica WH47]ELP33424.1 hypothetical protein RBSWK_02609 [Rhodopirellula baltica SWK14]|tara:strand:- start:183 stop:485 length:303 start_codon:yes stop_codon:yes gene_type:complete